MSAQLVIILISICYILNGIFAAPEPTPEPEKEPSLTPSPQGSRSQDGNLRYRELQELMTLTQRIHDRITGIEARENQRSRKLDSIDYRLTKLEILIQERSNTLEKIETNFGRRMETIEWETNKVHTLLEVMRDELDKIQKNQLEFKLAVSKLDPVAIGNRHQTTFITDDGDYQPAKLQIVQTTLNNLRRMSDTTHQKLDYLSRNMTDLKNKTTWLMKQQNKCLTKEYFHVTMKDITAVQQDSKIILETCNSAQTNETSFPRDCTQVLERGHQKSGVYQIKPIGMKTMRPFFVYCDMKTDGGGWTVLQRRKDGSINFMREWPDYKNGFGNVMGEHWLGNEKIYLLTNQDIYQLRFELEDFDDQKAYADYSTFAIGSESEGYMIKILGGYEGDAGDSFTYHSSMKFSTPDMDNDPWDGGNCAELHTGGWWYNGCDTCNLNGQYLSGEVHDTMENKGIYWYEWHGPGYSLKKSEMKIRPKGFKLSRKDAI